MDEKKKIKLNRRNISFADKVEIEKRKKKIDRNKKDNKIMK